MTTLYQTIEAPLINVLRDMEYEGVRINPDFLADYSKELEKEILRVEQEVYREAGTLSTYLRPNRLVKCCLRG